jgi:hypothetical protein
MLPLKGSSALPLYWRTPWRSHQYRTVACLHGNATLFSIYIVVELQCCCQQCKRTYHDGKCSILTKFLFSRSCWVQVSIMTFNGNPSNGNRVNLRERTDRRTWRKSKLILTPLKVLKNLNFGGKSKPLPLMGLESGLLLRFSSFQQLLHGMRQIVCTLVRR